MTLFSFSNMELGHVPEDERNILSLLLSDICPDPNCATCLEHYAGWYRTCETEHSSCRVAANPLPLPTRVIDVGSSDQDPFLCVSNNRNGKWVALSYCWGGNSDYILTQNSFDELKKAIKLGDAPKTIADAIKLTRALGIQYLWGELFFQQPPKANANENS